MSVRNIEDIYPLSSMQLGMLFHSLYDPESGAYFEQSAWTLRGDLDILAFEQAWQRTVERHPVLRTAFMWEGLDEPLQVVHRQVDLPLAQHDWRGLSETEQAEQFEAFLQTDRERGFELSEAPLMRLALIQTAEDTYRFAWSHHHLLMDGWSQPIIFQEVFALYRAFQHGQDVALEPARPYRDYIAWLQQHDPAEAEAFWQRTLRGFTAPTPLTMATALPHPESAEGEEDYAVQRTALPAATTVALQTLARQYQLTLNTVVQGAWAILLSYYSGEEDVVFGATVSGRPADLPGAETMVGLFINTLPVRIWVRPEVAVLSWLKEIQAQQAELRQYEYSPLVEIQGWSDVPRDVPLFESILVFENYPVSAALQAQAASLAIERGHSFARTNYPLTVAVSPGQEIGLEIAYDCRRFDAGTIRRMMGHLGVLLEGLAANPQTLVADLPLLPPAEQQQLLVEWNDTEAEYPREQCAHQLFEAQAERTPEAIAATFEGETLTYRELDRRANQLAHYLRKLGVGPETIVGICVERSLEMIVGALGILKAGGAYLPLDPTYPVERLAFMIEDTRLPVLLIQERLLRQVPAGQIQVVCLDTEWERVAQENEERLETKATPENLAYVIYTSGSTGEPKGTMLQHRGLCSLVTGFAHALSIGPDSHVLQFFSFGFDGSVAEIFPTLLAGATLCLARQERLLSTLDLLQLLHEQGITLVTMPPSMLAILPADGLPALQTVISAGESCPPEVAARWSSGRRFINGYGPTETTVAASLYQVEEKPEGMTNVPIGRPLLNTHLYVLDQHLRPVPVGLPGELYIGGACLARGYLNRPELTAERFVPDPFAGLRAKGNRKEGNRKGCPYSGEPGMRLYKTGDLVRYLPDGNLEFLGRADDQVKLRGFRVELGEIEAVLSQHPAIHQAVVLAREDQPGDKHLVAYVVPEDGAAPDTTELRAFLKGKLPAYMVPSTFVTLATLPLLPNGKVNRRALPASEGGRPELATAYVAPRTPVEEVLAELWARTLGLERVGVHDNFFESGGHSLRAMQLVSRVREAFQVELPVRAVFEMPTVAGLAEQVETALRSAAGLLAPPITPTPRDQAVPLSFAQQRLWFLDQLAPGNLFYNIPLAVRLTGQLDVTALERSLNEIVRRHEVLRTTFRAVDGKPVQVIAPELSLPLTRVDLAPLPEAEREAEMRRLVTEEVRQPFDLAHGPLLRACLLRLGLEEHVALLTMHHIISDGWSMEVLIRELATLYDAFRQGQPSPLPELPIQYADFAHWQREWLQGGHGVGATPAVALPQETGPSVLERQLAYWKQQLGDGTWMLDLPTDRPRPAVQTSRGSQFSFTLPQALSKAIKALSQQQGVTLFMALLAAFQALLYRYTGQESIRVGTPIANRTQAEIEGLIGFFVNTLVLHTDLSGDPSFEELLERIRDVALGAYTHQDLPFEMLVEALQPQRDLSHTPLFQVMFVMNTPSMKVLALPGLSLSPVEVDSGAATFDMTLAMAEGPDGLGGYVEYNTDLFDRTTVERMLGHLQTLLEAVVADPTQYISTLPILTAVERQQLLVEWNATAMGFPRDECIHHLFEAQVAERPDAIAVIFEGQQWTYRELNRRANQLAHYLQKLGVGRETLVGLSTERSPEMVVGILGTLKAGGAYLPLDPTYPQERLAFMLQDSRIPVLLTQAHLLERLLANRKSQIANRKTEVVCLDADWPTIAQESQENPHSGATADNLAYVIYTSGSTGKPKGTLLPHRGLCNLTDVQRLVFGIREGSRVLQFSPLSFDASVWETFMALRNGATLCLARQEVLASGQDLVQLMHEVGVTNVTLPPSVLRVLPVEPLLALQTVIAAGEACTPELVERWAPGRGFFNAYGPTETTVCASMYLCDERDPQAPPIGQPIANTALYVLDRNLQPVPVGVPGELYIGGVSLARGYLHQPDLTAERFIADPFSDEPGARLYKTGDLVRYRADGNIEFLGRIDQQVKVRGFRIELGEIETALGKYPGLHAAAVVAREDIPGDRRLVAYVVPAQTPAPTVAELRSFLRQTLPEYMVPSAFVYLETLPLSPSGKIDRRALPAPEGLRPEMEREYVAPRTPAEEKLAEICAGLLGIERVGVYDSFFDLGGHSLLATQFLSRLRDAFHVELPLRALFENPTVAGLAEAIEKAEMIGTEPPAPAIVSVSREAHRMKRSTLSQDSDSE